jgi:hypothetical protein
VPVRSWDEIQELGQEGRPLIDFWEALGQEHELIERTEHDAWPKTVCWTRFRTLCSCGWEGPVVSITDAEARNDAHVMSHVTAHRQLHYLKHLIQELLEQKGDIPT